jgi:hypothetical protein
MSGSRLKAQRLTRVEAWLTQMPEATMTATLEELGVERVPPSIAVERGQIPILFTAALPVAGGIRCGRDGLETIVLPRSAARRDESFTATTSMVGFHALRRVDPERRRTGGG